MSGKLEDPPKKKYTLSWDMRDNSKNNTVLLLKGINSEQQMNVIKVSSIDRVGKLRHQRLSLLLCNGGLPLASR